MTRHGTNILLWHFYISFPRAVSLFANQIRKQKKNCTVMKFYLNQSFISTLKYISIKISAKNLWKIKKRQQGITTCCQIKGMLYVSQWNYVSNSQDRKVCNFMLIAPQWIHSAETYQCWYYCVWIINCDCCVWYSKMSELSLFSLKFIDRCVSAFHVCINISDLILHVWIMERIYFKPSVITSLSEIYLYV